MKKINVILSSLLFLSLTIVSCSKDDSATEVIPAPDSGVKSITIGAPAFTDDSKSDTRVVFENADSKMTMTWSAGDQITVTTSESQSAVYTTAAGGSSATFTKTSGDDIPTSGVTYTITYKGSSVGENGAVTNEQTQTGNGNTEHLNQYYQATLSGINTLENVEFNSTWAVAHGGGTFQQSAILKFTLTLPSGSKVKDITNVEIRSTSNLFSTDNVNSGTKKYASLTFSDASDETNVFTGYVMLPIRSRSWNNIVATIKATTKNGWIKRQVTFKSGSSIGASGTMKNIPINSKWTILYTFDNLDGLTGYSDSDGNGNIYFYNKTGTSSTYTSYPIENGLYFLAGGNKTSGGVRVVNTASVDMTLNGELLGKVSNHIIPQRNNEITPSYWTENFHSAATADASNYATAALNVDAPGTLYAWARLNKGNTDATMRIEYQNNNKTRTSWTSTYVDQTTSKTQGEIYLASTGTGNGVYYLYGIGDIIMIYAIMFVPNE